MCKKAIELTEKAAKLRKAIIVFFIIHIILIIILGVYESKMNPFKLVTFSFIIISVVTCNYNILQTSLMFCIYDFFYLVASVGVRIQCMILIDEPEEIDLSNFEVIIGLELACGIVSGLIVKYLFEAYKEFRYISIWSNGNYKRYQNDVELQQGIVEYSKKNDSSMKRSGGYKAFSGKGVQLG